MYYTVNGLAQLAGISPRTLRWYDQKKLLPPTKTTPAGYRLYGPAAVDRLQQILFYKELDFSLAEIKELLDNPEFSAREALQSHLVALKKRRSRIDGLILTIQKTLTKGEKAMSDQEKFEAFKTNLVKENEREYGKEIRKRYGDQAVETANQAMMHLSKAQYQEWEQLGETIVTELTRAVQSGLLPESLQGQQIAQLHGKWCAYSLGKYDPNIHAGLAQLYTADQRFTAYYDRETPGCAAFLQQAILYYTSTQEEKKR